jgi:hypothetical protein
MIKYLIFICHIVPTFVFAQWSIEHSRGLPERQRGNLEINLFGNRVFSHAFNTQPKKHFSRKIPAGSFVELIYTVEESVGAIWGGNPMRENVPDAAPTLGIIIQHDWHSGMGRWYSVARSPLTVGTHRLVVPITPSAWQGVFGKLGDYSTRHRRGWRDVWSEPSRVGICAGGFFRAHGVEMLSGSGTIRVLTLRVKN